MTTILKKKRKETPGFTLVETIITVFVLSVAAIGFTKLLIATQYAAEDNLYDSTAQTVALSTLEQMKNANVALLETSVMDGRFDLVVKELDVITNEETEVETLDLDEQNVLQIPLVTNNASSKTLQLMLTPRIIRNTIPDTADEVVLSYMLEVEYAYNHPQTQLIRTKTVRCLRSNTPVN